MKTEKELLEKFQVEELEKRYEFRDWTNEFAEIRLPV